MVTRDRDAKIQTLQLHPRCRVLELVANITKPPPRLEESQLEIEIRKNKIGKKKASTPRGGWPLFVAVVSRRLAVVLVVIPIAVMVAAPLPGLLHLGAIFVSLAAVVAMMLYVVI